MGRFGKAQAAIAILLACVACAPHGNARTALAGDAKRANPPAGAKSGSNESSPAFPWIDPLVNGETIQDIQSAELSFVPVSPTDVMGTLVAIKAEDPTKVPEDLRLIAWVIRASDGTLFDVVEKPPSQTQADLQSAVKCGEGEAGCDTTGWSLADIGTGAPGLLIDGSSTVLASSATSFDWISNGIEFAVFYPPVEGSSQVVLDLARDLIQPN